MRAINSSLPKMDDNFPAEYIPDHKKLPIDQRKDLKIEYVESQFFPDLKVWWNDEVKTKWLYLNSAVVTAGGVPASVSTAAAPAGAAATEAAPTAAAPAAIAAAPAADAGTGSPDGGAGYGGMMSGSGSMDSFGGAAAPAASDVSMINAPGPSGPGWVMEIAGYHFYNNPKNSADRRKAGAFHLTNTLIKNLQHGEVVLPMGPGQPPERFKLKELGIDFVILARDPTFRDNVAIENPNFTPPVGGQVGGAFGGDATVPGAAVQPKIDPENPPYFLVRQYNFVVQFVWVETPLSVRIANRLAAAKAAESAAAGQAAEGTSPAAGPATAVPTNAGPTSTVPTGSVAPPGAPAPPAVTAPPVDPAAALSVPSDAAGGPPAAPANPAAPVPAPPVPAPGVTAPGAPASAPAAPASAPAASGAATGTSGAAAPASPPSIPAIPDVPM